MIPETLEAKDLLVRDEIAEMISACKKSIRDQAIVSVTFESAARIKEAANLRWGDLEYTPEGDNLIFIDLVSGGRMQYRAIAYVITRSADRAGITKKVTPHRFRKSRISEMARDGYQESVIKEIAWANQNTNMMKIYLKLGKDDVYNEFLDKSGIKKKQAAARHCHMCGIELTEQARNYQESWKNAVSNNPDYMIDLLMEMKQKRAQAQEGK